MGVSASRHVQVLDATVPIDLVLPEGNIRSHRANDEAAKSLLQSVRAVGILEPLLMTPLPKGAGNSGFRYQLVAGFRRFTAACQAGLDCVSARVLPRLSPAQVMEIRLTENLQRQDMTPIEEAKAIRSYVQAAGITQEFAARKLGKPGSWVSFRLGLLDLPEEVQDLVERGRLTVGHAVALHPFLDHPKDEVLRFARRGTQMTLKAFQVSLSASYRARHRAAARRGGLCDCNCRCCLARVHEVLA